MSLHFPILINGDRIGGLNIVRRAGTTVIRAWLCRHHTWGRPHTYGWSTLTYRHCRHCGASDHGRPM